MANNSSYKIILQSVDVNINSGNELEDLSNFIAAPEE